MADMPKSYVTILRSFEVGGPSGKAQKVRVVNIRIPSSIATAYGDPTNPIPASVFDLSFIEECTNARNQDPASAKAFVACTPGRYGLTLETCSLVQATDANRGDISAQIARTDAGNSSNWLLTVKGY